MGSPAYNPLMPRPRVYKTEAIVLRHQNLGDADKIVTIYSPFLGKLRVVGKGVLKPRSRVGGHVEPLSRVSLLIARGQNLDVISQVSPIESFVELRDDLHRTAQALYAAELLDLFTGEEDASPELYEAFLETLKALTLNKDGGLVLRRYELRLLTILGYAPELDSCVVCRASSFQGGASFNSSAGGLVCGPCAEVDGSARPISRDALTSFRYLRNADPSAIAEKVTPERLAGEMELILGRYIRYQLEREVRSAGFLDRLASLPSGR